jgi:pyrimidine operon attenuation protein / uracil phosphoribosyltransferase
VCSSDLGDVHLAQRDLPGRPRGGAILARRLRKDLQAGAPPGTAGEIPLGEVDISLYRDDYHLQAGQPRVLGTEISFDVEGKLILLVDDVLYTGRTVRAAIDQILDFGRPRKILLAVLIDRGHRELPIASDFTGRRIETAREDRVEVSFRETDGEDRVELIGPR